jgi:protoporphyrinogen oxidase
MRNIVALKEDSDWGPNNTFHYPLYGGTGGLFNKFRPYTKGHLSLDKDVVRINTGSRELVFQDGERVKYDVLISTMPLSELLGKLDKKPGHIEKALADFNWNGGYMVGIGINKPRPSNKNWMYFPQEDSPFYRVTYLSNYSPNI